MYRELFYRGGAGGDCGLFSVTAPGKPARRYKDEWENSQSSAHAARQCEGSAKSWKQPNRRTALLREFRSSAHLTTKYNSSYCQLVSMCASQFMMIRCATLANACAVFGRARLKLDWSAELNWQLITRPRIGCRVGQLLILEDSNQWALSSRRRPKLHGTTTRVNCR